MGGEKKISSWRASLYYLQGREKGREMGVESAK